MNSPFTISLLFLLVSNAAFERVHGADPDERIGQAPDYLVISFVGEENEYFEAARLLAKRHDAKIIKSSPKNLNELQMKLAERPPRSVAFVIEPSDININVVEQILLMSTRMDFDPFVDFEYGFITGRNGKAAVGLVNAAGKPKYKMPAITLFGVGSKQMGKSGRRNTSWPLGKGKVPLKSLNSIGETDETRDSAFIEKSLAELDRAPILLLASHGYPDGLVGGIKASDIRGRDFGGTVALNIACYNGVTSSWYEDDWSTMTVKERQVDSQDSFCLQMIDNGVAAYVAYVTPRPAGPTMFGDALIVASSGKTMGELRKEDANRIVLAHLMTGDEKLMIKPLANGQTIKAGRLPGDIVKRMSTGGVLIGDPAFQPFAKEENSEPRIQSIETTDDGLIVKTTIKSPIHHMFTAAQINYWEKKSSAIRLESVVPIGNAQSVADIRVLESPSAKYQFVAAIEHDEGKRHLRFKWIIPQATNFIQRQKFAIAGVSGKIEVVFDDKAPDRESDSKIFRRSGGKSR